MADTEIPKYQVLERSGDFEIRRYEPIIVAEVSLKGTRKSAISAGFQLLADYIFGNNTSSGKIAMTAPVQQQSEKIAMTAPVQQQSDGDIWTVNFVMPSQYTMETLPKPNNAQVRLKEVPAKNFVSVQFAGFNSDGNIRKHETRLMDFLRVNNLQTVGEPIYAFYDPPWTLPNLRRNEVMVELAE